MAIRSTVTLIADTVSDVMSAQQAAVVFCVATNKFYTWNGAAWVTISAGSIAVNNAPARSLVTVAAAANGFQVSASRDSLVIYSVKVSTTSTIAGGAQGDAVLEIAATNSALAADWIEISRVESGQTLGLAITLSIVQPITEPLSGIVPAGWYARIRTISTTGSPAFTYISGQESQF